jgi:aminopeptidase N
MKRIIILSILAISLSMLPVNAQVREFTRQDTLRGSITPEREWWDLTWYHLDISVSPSDSTIKGSVEIGYRVLSNYNIMQVDLQEPMKITSVVQDGKNLNFTKDGNAWFVEIPGISKPGADRKILVNYEGNPKVARRPPWDGGISWDYDDDGNPWVVSTCQGDGASLWWPCKDHMYDEPDSMLISVSVPEDLVNVSNGRLRSVVSNPNGTRTWNWFVSNPINNYGVNINVGNYTRFGEVFNGELGDLDCDYWVLPYHLDKAREQFKQAPMMLEAFEHWFGPYPFYEDSYKLVEVPYPGMEHQSSVTYGNGFRNGYGGRDVSRTGWGDRFDFILVHESGHEWFANNITYRDIADMWIHESFIAYSEGLYVEYWFGKEAGFEYLRGIRSNITNNRPIIGIYDVNVSGSGDMYQKGATMLHTLRQVIDDDEKWRGLLRGLNKEFWHQTVTTEQVEGYISEYTGLKLQSFFDQFLRDTRIPTLEYRFLDGMLMYRWGNCVMGFDIPVRVTIDGKPLLLKPRSGRWTALEEILPGDLVIERDYYAASINLMGK